MCDLFGIDAGTVKRGRQDLDSRLEDQPADRARLPGGGRKRVEEVDPGVEEALRALTEPETAGDPCSSRKWTRPSLRELSKRLKKTGHDVGRHTVKRLLKKGGTRSEETGSASRAPRTQTETPSSST